ncbi:MAG TPA: hypothetical protein VK530_14385, partial [Candidatus Acidoferrum sp.]|nr:hypothetical protein [Candidatus Acidoferrum sp.]
REEVNSRREEVNSRREDVNLGREEVNSRGEEVNLRREEVISLPDEMNSRRENVNLQRRIGRIAAVLWFYYALRMPRREWSLAPFMPWLRAIVGGISSVSVALLPLAGLVANAAVTPKALVCAPLAPWVLRNSGTTSNFHDIIFSNGMFVAVGTSTNMTCSTDGVSWINRAVTGTPAFTGGAWNSITYGNNTFAVAGSRPIVAVSTNGIGWTASGFSGLVSSATFGERWFCFTTTNFFSAPPVGAIYIGTNVSLAGLTQTNVSGAVWKGSAYGNRRFVCVAENGTTMMSTNATNWLRSSTGVSNMNRVAFGLGMFVAVGASGAIVTSNDGLSWTQRVSNSSANFTAITFGDGRFVAISDSSPNLDDGLVNSRNGIDWCAYPLPTNAAWRAIAYGNNNYVMVGANGTVMQSLGQPMILSPLTNQIVCAEEPFALAVQVTSSLPVQYQWQFMGTNIPGATNATFGHDRAYLENSGAYRVIVSDGRIPAVSTGWVQVNLCRAIEHWVSQVPAGSQSNSLNSIACNGDMLVAVGNGGAITFSADGVQWSSADSGTNVSLNAVTYGAGKFVAVGTRGVILSSPDGGTWTRQNSGTNGSLRGIAFAQGNFVVVGGNTYVLTSPDGITWTSRLTGTNRASASIAYADGQFVTVGAGGMILTSPNAINWASANSGITSNLFRIAAGNASFVAAGDGIVLCSQNGIEWAPQTTPVTNVWRSVCFAHGQFLLVGNGGVLVTSPDGITWTLYDSGLTNIVNAVAGCGDFIYSATTDGLISQSAFAARPRLVGELDSQMFTLGLKAEIGAPLRLQSRGEFDEPWSDVFAFTNTRTVNTIFTNAVSNGARRFYRVTSP